MHLNVHNVVLIIAASFLPVVLILLGIKYFNDDMAICFNDSSADGRYGVWVYEEHRDWRQARDDIKGMLVFGFRPGQPQFAVSDLDYCWFSNNDSSSRFERCAYGTLRIDHIQPKEQVIGHYAFSLTDGELKSREFSATYCPPESQDE